MGTGNSSISVITPRNLFANPSSGFSNNEHLQPRCGRKEEIVKETNNELKKARIEKNLKLIKSSPRRNCRKYSAMDFVTIVDHNKDAKDDVLWLEFQQLRAEGKQIKRNRKDRAKLKASSPCSSTYSSSSCESSDSEDLVDMTECLRRGSLAEPRVNEQEGATIQAEASSSSAHPSLSTEEQKMLRRLQFIEL